VNRRDGTARVPTEPDEWEYADVDDVAVAGLPADLKTDDVSSISAREMLVSRSTIEHVSHVVM